MPDVGVMCWNLHFCSIRRFLSDDGAATGFANLVAGIAIGQEMGILGLLEIMDGGAANPGGAWKIGDALKTRLNATKGSSGKWDFQVSSRQLNESECNILLWDEAQAVPNNAILPGPFFSPCVVNNDAFIGLQTKYGIKDSDVDNIISWLQANNLIKTKSIHSIIDGDIDFDSYKYVNSSFANIISKNITNNPPTPKNISSGNKINYTNDLYQTLQNIDFLWFHKEADRAPFIGSFLCGTSQTPLTVAIFHAPKPGGLGALMGTIPVGLSRFLKAQPNVVVMGDFNCSVRDTGIATDAYGYDVANSKWQKMDRATPFYAITNAAYGIGADYWQLGSPPLRDSTDYTLTTLCSKCPSLTATPESLRVNPYDRLFFKGANFTLSTADCGDIISLLMNASTDENAKGLSQALCQYFPNYFPRTEKGKQISWSDWITKKIDESGKKLETVDQKISQIEERIEDEENHKKLISKSSKKISRGKGGKSSFSADFYGKKRKKGGKSKSVSSMRSEDLKETLSSLEDAAACLGNAKATYSAANTLINSPAKIITQSGEAWVLVTKAVSDHLPIYTTLTPT